MKTVLLMDYATFNFAPDSISMPMLAKCISGQENLCFVQKGLSSGSPWQSPFGINYLPNSGYSVHPIRIQFSGVGCNHYEAALPFLRSFAENHISRCDFAFDVLMSKDVWRSYIETIFSAQLDQSRQAKKYVMTGSGLAQTIYIGSRKCAKFCRIYNKSLEDSSYTAVIDDKKVCSSDDQFIIRFELELKHFKGKGQNFDASEWYDAYFDDQDNLISFIKDTWRLYAEDFILPCPLDDLELVCRFDKNKNFVQSRDEIIESVNDERFESPRIFDNTVRYIADRYGKYIPFILYNPFLRQLVFDKCKQYCGFDLEVIVSSSESGFYELEDIDDDMYINPWQDEDCEQIDILTDRR